MNVQDLIDRVQTEAGLERRAALRDLSRDWPRRAGLAMSLESYARAIGLPPAEAARGWRAWGLIFLGASGPAVPIPGFAPADVIEVEP